MMEEEFVKQEVSDDLDADNNIHGQYHCKECNKVYSSKKKLDGHISFVHTIQIVVCEFCSKEFKNKTACKQHVRNVHESASSKEEACPTCGKTFKRKSLVDAHIRNVHESADNLFCHVCGSQSKNLNALKKHVKKCEEKPKRATKHFVPGNRVGDPELGNNTYYDEFCDRTYLNYNSFRIHNHNTHTDDPISCRICETVLKSRDLIRRHYMMKHNILDKEVLKDLSGAGFGKRAQIKEGSDATMMSFGKLTLQMISRSDYGGLPHVQADLLSEVPEPIPPGTMCSWQVRSLHIIPMLSFHCVFEKRHQLHKNLNFMLLAESPQILPVNLASP